MLLKYSRFQYHICIFLVITNSISNKKLNELLSSDFFFQKTGLIPPRHKLATINCT